MRSVGLFCIAIVLCGAAIGAPASTPAAAPAPTVPLASVAHQLSVRDALLLGLIEGVTEFLPVSSTGHLIIADDFLGLNDARQLTDALGRPLWIKPPSAKNPEGRPLTIKAAADSYAVIIQVGAIAAVVLLYWRQLWQVALGLFGLDRDGTRLLRNIVLAVLPAAVLGLSFEHWIDEHLFSVGAVAGAAAVGAVFMFWVDRWRRRSTWQNADSRQPADLRPHEALLVGGLQCVAMWPGTSRSMMTIAAGYFVGLSPARSAEFSFLVGLVTLTGAGVLKGFKIGPAMLEVFGWQPVLLGMLVALVSAALAIKLLVALLTRFGFGPFAVYRLVLAVALLASL